MNALKLFALNFVLCLVVTVNWRAIASLRYEFAFVSDVTYFVIQYATVRRIVKSDHLAGPGGLRNRRRLRCRTRHVGNAVVLMPDDEIENHRGDARRGLVDPEPLASGLRPVNHDHRRPPRIDSTVPRGNSTLAAISLIV